MIITGMIIGDIRNEKIRVAPLNLCRVRVRAAMIASAVASRLDNMAIFKLFSSAVIQMSEPKKFRYHLSENSFGGNWRKLAELKEIGITTNSGRIRKSKISPHKL
jgi:hypothetical protein